MRPSKKLLVTAIACASALLAACSEPAAPTASAAPAPAAAAPMAAPAAPAGNNISGVGMTNPNPVVTQNWGALPAGRTWGSTAGVDIDPNDGQIVAYERCGAGSFGAGAPVTCDTNVVDPIFKFDRATGAVIANFGAGGDQPKLNDSLLMGEADRIGAYLNSRAAAGGVDIRV